MARTWVTMLPVARRTYSAGSACRSAAGVPAGRGRQGGVGRVCAARAYGDPRRLTPGAHSGVRDRDGVAPPPGQAYGGNCRVGGAVSRVEAGAGGPVVIGAGSVTHI